MSRPTEGGPLTRNRTKDNWWTWSQPVLSSDRCADDAWLGPTTECRLSTSTAESKPRMDQKRTANAAPVESRPLPSPTGHTAEVEEAGEDGNCDVCLKPENSEHFLPHCPQFQPQRTGFLGPILALSILQEDPETVIRSVRATGLLRGVPSATGRVLPDN